MTGIRIKHALLVGLSMLILCLPCMAAPGICVGPVCGDQFSRSAKHYWQLRLQVSDQRGQRERLIVDCRYGVISPRYGPVERGYVEAVAQRACRFLGGRGVDNVS